MQNMTHEQRTMADAALANKMNVIHHAYVDITGDLIAGALLGQILYWFGAGRDGKIRARIVKDGHLWIAKARTDWHDEIRISPKQYDRAAKLLKEKGFIYVATYKFAGNPTTHIRIVPEAINAALDLWKREQVKAFSPDGEQPADSGFSPFGNNDFTETASAFSTDGEAGHIPIGDNGIDLTATSFTEITAENKKETTAENTRTLAASPSASGSAALDAYHNTVSIINRDFERVWREYPKKEGKQKAKQAFARAVQGMGSRRSDGEPYTADEILAEVVLYRQHVERLLDDRELTYRYIPTGGAWFEREGWTDETPSISSSFEDFDKAREYTRNALDLRRYASAAGKARGEERDAIRWKIDSLISSMPY